jgi:hypothetical protein
MESKQNPFSFYDFLGYFTPGAVFLYALVLIAPKTSVLNSFSTFLDQIREIDKVALYVPFVLLAYVLGHVLSFLSSITIEIYSIWSSGYPSKYLLGVPVDRYFTYGKPKRVNLTTRILFLAILLPVTVFDFLIGRCLKFKQVYTKALDPLLVQLITSKIILLLKDNGLFKKSADKTSPKTDNYFRFVYHYCVEYAPNHLPKMQNYVALYGFLRTLTFIAVLGFWMLFFLLIENQVSCSKSICILLWDALFCYVLFMAFTKFYRRFTLEAFMALTAIYPSANRL